MPRHHATRGASLSAALVEFAKAHCEVRTLSVYVAGGMTDPADRRHWEVVLKRSISQRRRTIARRSREEREAFESCVTALRGALPSSEAVHGAVGWACFAASTGAVLCQGLDFPVEPSVTWQVGLRMAPCLGSVAHTRAIVAVADRKHAALFRLEHGTLSALETIDVEAEVEPGTHMGSAPRQGFHTGTRGETQRDAASRKMRESRVRHAAHVAERIATLASGDSDIVIGGVADTDSLIADGLPGSFTGRIVRTGALRATMPLTEVFHVAETALRDLEASRQVQLAGALVDDIGRNGHAAAGVLDVIHALEQRAVDHLLVSPTLVRRQPDAIDRIVQEALFERADIEVAQPAAAELLDRNAEGIVARLRFPIPPSKLKPPRRRARRARQGAMT